MRWGTHTRPPDPTPPRRHARPRLRQADGDHGSPGSGKSTLMHCLVGLDAPTFGRIVIDGVDGRIVDEVADPTADAVFERMKSFDLATPRR
jgi:hypothetical protein